MGTKLYEIIFMFASSPKVNKFSRFLTNFASV